MEICLVVIVIVVLMLILCGLLLYLKFVKKSKINGGFISVNDEIRRAYESGVEIEMPDEFEDLEKETENYIIIPIIAAIHHVDKSVSIEKLAIFFTRLSKIVDITEDVALNDVEYYIDYGDVLHVNYNSDKNNNYCINCYCGCKKCTGCLYCYNCYNCHNCIMCYDCNNCNKCLNIKQHDNAKYTYRIYDQIYTNKQAFYNLVLSIYDETNMTEYKINKIITNHY